MRDDSESSFELVPENWKLCLLGRLFCWLLW